MVTSPAVHKLNALIERLLWTDELPAHLIISEAADKYTPMVGDLSVALQDGRVVNVFDIDPLIGQYANDLRRALRREDRIVWALRFYKKALVYELLWMAKHDQAFFHKKFGAPPAPEQSMLEKKYRNLSDIDITPFEERDPEDPENVGPAYLGFAVADTIKDRIGHFLEIADKYGERDPVNPINTFQFSRQPFGEVVSALRRGEIELMRKNIGLHISSSGQGGRFDLRDEEGPIETIVKFPNGWRWLNLHRNCSEIRNDPEEPSSTAITGHCANTAGKGEVTLLELVEPISGDLWKHHAMFVLSLRNGLLGEMKGRKNQKPSPRLHKYIAELFKQFPAIKGIAPKTGGHLRSNDFDPSDLSPTMLADLQHGRPDIFGESRESEKAEPE